MLNLLYAPIIVASVNSERTLLTLPATFAGLVNDEIDDFINLQPRQSQLWHQFLCRTAALAMIHSNVADPPESERRWYEILRALTAADFPLNEPWELINPNYRVPAFLQPPTSRHTASTMGKPKPYPMPPRPDVGPPAPRAMRPSLVSTHIDHWVYFLVEAQTAPLYHQRRGCAIPRTHSHYHHLTAGIYDAHSPGAAFVHHLRILLDNFTTADAAASLHWLIPWSGLLHEQIVPQKGIPPQLAIHVNRIIRVIHTRDEYLYSEGVIHHPRLHPALATDCHSDPWDTTQHPLIALKDVPRPTGKQLLHRANPRQFSIPLMARANQAHLQAKSPHYRVSQSCVHERYGHLHRSVSLPIPDELIPTLADPGQHNDTIANLIAQHR